MQQSRGSEKTIRITAASFESLAEGTRIGFPIPGAELASNPQGFRHFWEMIQFVFQLSDPASVPPLDVHPDRDPYATLRRYCEEADNLASSPLLSYPTSVEYSVPTPDTWLVKPNFPPLENERGFAVHLRQFFVSEESASFKRVYNICWVHSEASGSHRLERQRILAEWARAEKKLRHRSPKLWVGLKLVREGRFSGVPGLDDPPVEQLIAAFSYGDLIHWGKKRVALADLTKDEFESSRMRMALYGGMVGLAHLYIGFAVVVRTLFPGLEEARARRR